MVNIIEIKKWKRTSGLPFRETFVEQIEGISLWILFIFFPDLKPGGSLKHVQVYSKMNNMMKMI